MIERIQLFMKDPAKIARAATVGFFIMVAIAVWFLLTLRHDLVYDGGWIDSDRAGGVFAKLFIVIGFAFVFCYGMIFFMQKAKKETIVYLDKKIESAANQSSAAGESNDSFNSNLLKEKIRSGNSTEEKLQLGINEICNQLQAGQGALYLVEQKGEERTLEMKSAYSLALAEDEATPSFQWGEGLIGEVAGSGKSFYLDELPEGYANRIESGLGSALPKFLFIFPIQKEKKTAGVIEVATFAPLSESLRKQTQEAAITLSEII